MQTRVCSKVYSLATILGSRYSVGLSLTGGKKTKWRDNESEKENKREKERSIQGGEDP